MKITRTLYFIFSFLSLFLFRTADATHLVGGSMGYQYMGRLANGDLKYKITLTIYRDCTGNVDFDNLINIGVHNNNSTKSLLKTVEFSLLSKFRVNPPGSANCEFKPDVCLERGFYEGFINVPPSTVGYHLTYVRCCRNRLENLPNSAGGGEPYLGQTYYCFIPPTNIVNSSPYFSGIPVPYMCANDLTSVLNTAIDPDGDSLVYSFAIPYTGGNLSSASPDPPPFLTFPIENVVYNPGYSFLQPFGPGGVATINSTNGLTNFLSPSTGKFAVAMVVKEYRNGVFLSEVKLDLQIIIINCPPNNKPVINSNPAGMYKEVEAGKQICFQVTGFDPDNDNVRIRGIGDIFTGANGFKPPLATLPTATARGTVNSTFCWNTSCDQARELPYIFTVEALDDGCPAKLVNINFTIKVNPFKSDLTLIGNNPVCANEEGILYRANGGTSGSSYNWTVSGGTIVSGNGTPLISVNWGSAGTGNISVTETSSAGCKGTPASLQVTITPAPAKPVISGDSVVCEYATSKPYSVKSNPGSTYKWLVSGGTISAGGTGNLIAVNWGPKGAGMIKVVETNSMGCVSDTGLFPVNIVFPTTGPITGSPSVCPNIKGVTYSTNNTPGSSYFWSVTGGTIASGGNNSSITVDWGGLGSGKVNVVEVNKYGCMGDTVRKTILIDHKLIGQRPVGDTVYCEFTLNAPYTVLYTNGSAYHWTITGGTQSSGDSSANIKVNWGAAGTAKVAVYETSFDPVGKKLCISNEVEINVILNPIPKPTPIQGVTVACQSNGTETYSVTGFPGSTFSWSLNGNNNLTGQGTNQVTIPWNQPGNFTLSVFETSKDGCQGPVNSMNILIHPKPTTTSIDGQSIICFPQLNGYVYKVKGFANSDFQWSINGGNIISGLGTPEVTVNWAGVQNSFIKVIETSSFGCPGDTLSLFPYFDKPGIDLKVVSVGFPKDNNIDIKWDLINGPFYDNKFFVQRRVAGSNNPWVTVGTVDGNKFSFNDAKLNTDENPFEYRVTGFDLCNQELTSETHTNVLLQGEKVNGYEVKLNHSFYEGWDEGAYKYEVYRQLPGKEGFELYDVLNGDQTVHYKNGLEYYKQCYRIKAYELNGKQETSWSNDVCFTFDPILYIPNAFTPTSDGLNERFQLVGGSIKWFEINIFNRWGEKIFTSNDLANSWDGTYQGAESPEGVYVYIVQFKGFDDVLNTRKGNVTLLR